MSETMISVKNLTKTFRHYSDRPSALKTYLIRAARGRFDFGDTAGVTVLDDVSFEINRGEFVGIMGANGVGKSTLLKLISGIYTPTKGSVEIHAQIAPMIELGAGFHPELSGYDNIFLNGAILGFGKAAVNAALPAIVEFSELGEKIHMPIKFYSSGMLTRLGFSIASHLTAPILLIDEVLSVGDVGFQEKCKRKIQEMHKDGRTIVLISHDPIIVEQYCSRCIVISDKKKIYDGVAKGGVAAYRALFR